MAAEALVKNGAEKVYITGRSKEKLEKAALANGQGVMVP
jgi:saccharopine dehydrogenase-like NADP-dependent oxidoreductase